MRCTRCDELMVRERLDDSGGLSSEHEDAGWRCITVGQLSIPRLLQIGTSLPAAAHEGADQHGEPVSRDDQGRDTEAESFASSRGRRLTASPADRQVPSYTPEGPVSSVRSRSGGEECGSGNHRQG